ncbi:MAG: hypothetical protein LBT26_10130 [Clostridiales Family XIII bacterium]|nr:hypothetical protein [Clostridiales Family XIII bacterium]
MEEKEKLIESIRAAFMGEQYPGDMDIVYDNTGYYLDVEEIKQKLIGKSWQEADKEFLFSERNDASHFFSKAGFKYYIPAFMAAAVAYYDEMDDLPDTLIGKFTFPEERDIAELEAAAKAGNALLPQFAAEPGDFFQRRQHHGRAGSCRKGRRSGRRGQARNGERTHCAGENRGQGGYHRHGDKDRGRRTH